MRGVAGIFSIITTMDDNHCVRGTPVLIVVLRMVLMILSISKSKVTYCGVLPLPLETTKDL